MERRGFIRFEEFNRKLLVLYQNRSEGKTVADPTSVAFMKACNTMGIQQAFTSYGNPKGNADTERVFRTMNEELLWLREWHSPFELTEALEKWIDDYNRYYLHSASALGYKSPLKFEEAYKNNQQTLLVTP